MNKNKIIAGSGGCFRKGAKVQLEGGETKPIEEVQIGDEVLSFDENGIITKSVVTKTHYHAEPEPLLKVRFWQGETYITPNHWVLNAIKTFSAMGDLDENEALVDGFGNLRPIISVEEAEAEPVYNLTVEPYHTFICDGICVHNGGYRASVPTIGGAGGGGKKSSKARKAVEDPNSLFSTSMISVLDILGEGEIGGLVGAGEIIEYDGEQRDLGAQSIFLDDTPLMNNDGSYNFDDVVWDSRNGTQNQDVIPTFGNVETATEVGVVIENKSGGHVITINNPNADAIRVVVSVSALTKTDTSTGDVHGASVSYKFEVRKDGKMDATSGWQLLGSHTISGKTTSTYQRAHEYYLPKSLSVTDTTDGSWLIRMTRITADHKTVSMSDTLNWDSYSVIVNSALSYPNSALVGVTVSADQFSSVPSRSYLVDGLKIRVPSNYTPPKKDLYTGDWSEAIYDGIWDGSYKLLVSSNPAWILFDLLTDSRYGLGEFISDDDIDVSKLYKIGKYCDEFVPSGYTDENGKKLYEPRFQVNTIIQQRTDAYSVISDICSAFRGMAYWSGGEVGIMADMPTDPSMEYSPSNVIDGIFTYQGSARKDRHSVAQVTWNNPSQYYQQEVEYIEDADMVEKYGIRENEIVDFGCTTRGQAHRAGLWMLYTEKYETDMITFDVGIDSSLVLPGDVIRIHDTVRAGQRMAGRIKGATAKSAILDSDIDTSKPVMFSVRLPDGSFYEARLVDPTNPDMFASARNSGNVVYWKDELPEDKIPLPNAIWMASLEDLEPIIARVVAIKQKDSSTFTISALEHNPSKYDAIEKGLTLDIPQTSIVNFSDASKVTNLKSLEIQYQVVSGAIGTKLLVSWTGSSTNYLLKYRRIYSDVIEHRDEYSVKPTDLNASEFDLRKTTQQYSYKTYGVDADGNSYVKTFSVIPEPSLDKNGNVVLDKAKNPVITNYEIVEVTKIGYSDNVDNWTEIVIGSPSYEILNVQSGNYEIEVQGMSLNGTLSGVTYLNHKVQGEVASPGDVPNFVVKKRTYDLLCTWDEVSDIKVSGYEIREGNSWDNARIVQANIQATSCVDDQDNAGTYKYMIRSIDMLGNYSHGVRTYILTLQEPQTVSGFTCVQVGKRIEFRWNKNPESDVVYYEIRKGENFATGDLVSQVDSTSLSIPSSSISGDVTYWIKAVASPGIYSKVEAFANVVTTTADDRNVVVEIDNVEKEWNKNKINTYKVNDWITIGDRDSYGEYIFDIDLYEPLNEKYSYIDKQRAKITAQTSIDSDFSATIIDNETWGSFDNTFESLKAERPWVFKSGTTLVDVKHYISTFKGFSSVDCYECFPMFEDVEGKKGNSTIDKSLNIDYVFGRYYKGAYVNEQSEVSWNINIPTYFNICFWYIPYETSSEKILCTIESDNDFLKVGIKPTTRGFYLTDNFNNTIEIKNIYPQDNQPVFICISQTATQRKLFVALLDGGLTSVVDDYVLTLNDSDVAISENDTNTVMKNCGYVVKDISPVGGLNRMSLF